MSDSMSQDNFIVDGVPANPQQTNIDVAGSSGSGGNRRQKSWDLLDQSALAQARQHKQPPAHQVCSHFHRFFVVIG